MTDAREALSAARAADLRDEDDEPMELEFRPGLSAAEIEGLVADHGPLPAPLREVLTFAAGFEGAIEVDFTGRTMAFGNGELFHRPLPIATDGMGNHWVVELEDGRVWFVGHDPPVLVLQSPDLDDFVVSVVHLWQPGEASTIDDVHEERALAIWAARDAQGEPQPSSGNDPGGVTRLVDLRDAQVGEGLAWADHPRGLKVVRVGDTPVFDVTRTAT